MQHIAAPVARLFDHAHGAHLVHVNTVQNRVAKVGADEKRIGGTGRIFKGRPRSTPAKTAPLFSFAVG
jgi:hypothetical protein